MNREELLKNAKQILFNTEMVQAILEGKKSVTRRIIKQGNILPTGDWLGEIKEGGEWCTNPRKDVLWTGFRSKYGADAYYMCRYQVGDILYVRETWSIHECVKCQAGIPALGGECKCEYVYHTNYGTTEDDSFPPSMFKWKPSIHMPKEAARIFLKVTDVRVERLQDITEEQAYKEGTTLPSPRANYVNSFISLWNSTVKNQDIDKYGWEANPWVWVIEFERVEVENE
jgi:hypothetical protein